MDKKKTLTLKRIWVVSIVLLLIIVAVLSLKEVRNGICKHTAYVVCIVPDFKPEPWRRTEGQEEFYKKIGKDEVF
jgi:hypothetical protein